MSTERTSSFQRNDRLAALLDGLNTSISGTRLPIDEMPSLPPLFLLGTARSGGTYCMQWLAASGAFSYPSNLIARFWQSPFVGAICQQMLTDPDYDFRGEFSDVKFHDPEQSSELGKTRGLLSPNEFWYFWRSIFPGDGDIGVDLSAATDEQFEEFDRKLREFSAIRSKPVATKGTILSHQLSHFAAKLPNALFLHLDRDPADTAWSLLRSRERMYGTQDTWYSFTTPNRDELSDLPPAQQVMGQVKAIRADLQAQLSALPQDRWISFDYAALCDDPGGCFDALRTLYDAKGITLDGANAMPPTTASHPAIPQDAADAFAAYLRR